MKDVRPSMTAMAVDLASDVNDGCLAMILRASKIAAEAEEAALEQALSASRLTMAATVAEMPSGSAKNFHVSIATPPSSPRAGTGGEEDWTLLCETESSSLDQDWLHA